MKKIYALIFLLFLTANLSAQNSFLKSLQNKNENLKESIIIFYKSGCPYCQEMEKQISSNNRFQEQIKNKYNVTLVDIENFEGKQIAKLYNITAVPAIIQNDSKNLVVQKSKGFGSLKKLALFLNIDYADTVANKKTTQVPAICGNGTVEIGEQCDDFNNANGDGCSDSCTLENLAICGNGTVEIGEQCDDFNNANGDGCSDSCKTEDPAICGNGIVEIGEQCDDSNTANGDGCNSSCKTETPAICGNGIVETGEQCDDFNTANGDGCNNTCTIEIPVICGNGIVEIGEQCDDFNNANGDGCKSDCTLETLGVTDYGSQFVVLGMYPNPFVNTIEVSFYLLHNSEIVFSIFDLNGKILSTIKKGNLNFGKNEVQLELDSLLSSGNYFLQMEINNSQGVYKQTNKIIKK